MGLVRADKKDSVQMLKMVSLIQQTTSTLIVVFT